MSDFGVTGAGDFLKLSKALKAAGRTEMRKGLNKGLRQAAKPLIPLTREAARSELPQHGGLAGRVAKAPQRVQVRTGADPGVRVVVGKSNSGARGADRGKIRHPVFGNTENWVTQPVRPGWFTDTILAHRDAILPALEQAMHDIVDDIVRGAR